MNTSHTRPTPARMISRLITLVAVTCVTSLFAIQPAQAAPQVSYEWRATSSCPCYLDDDVDGTYFQRDPGGEAAKVQLYDGTWLRAKGEFHPYGEKLWLYNTTPIDSNVVWVVSWPGGREVYDGPRRNSHKVIDLDIREGDPVKIDVYEHVINGKPTDRLATITGIA